MKRLLPLIVFTLCLLPSSLSAQTPCPAKRIEDCPPEGCGGWDKQLNLKKNLTSDPGRQTPQPMTVAQIVALGYPPQWYVGKDRSELENLGEGRFVQVTAYLIDVKDGNATSANCKLADLRLINALKTSVSTNDVLVLAWDQVETVSITAEITPRIRREHTKVEKKKQTTNWTRSKLKMLIDGAKLKLLINGVNRKAVLLRLTGLLLLDTAENPIVRSTDWEIHPILEIEVCLKANKCETGEDWQKLDAMKITSPPRRRSTTIIRKGRPRFKTRR